MLIRRMLPEDLDQAAELERLCFGKAAWSRQALEDALQDPNALYLAGVEEMEGKEGANGESGRLNGYCGVWQSFDEGEIMNVAVRPDCRGRGFGKRLLKELLSQAKERGMDTFVLEVRKGNVPAIRLYTSLGFQTVGVRKGFYEAPREDALIMKT